MSREENYMAFLGREKKARTGRGDLARLLVQGFEDEGLDMAADLVGYRRVERKSKDEPDSRKRAPDRGAARSVGVDSKKTEHFFPEPEKKVAFWHVATHVVKEKKKKTRPAWIEDKNAFEPGHPDTRENHLKTPPKHPPLVPWPQLWPFLRRALGRCHDSRSIDIKEAVRLISELKPVGRFPRRQKNGWAAACRILFDFDPRLTPFWSDMVELFQGIEKLHGRSGLEARILENGPDGGARKWGDPGGRSTYPSFPEPGTPILIVSDLGFFDPSGTAQKAWLRFGKRHNRAGFSPIVLNPCPPRRWPDEFTGVFQMACWDRGRRLPRVDQSRCIRTPLTRGSAVDETARADRLLSLLSPAIWVETSLLRAIRFLLPRGSADAATEAAVWNHDDVVSCSLGFSFKKDRSDATSRSGKKELAGKKDRFDKQEPLDKKDRAEKYLIRFRDKESKKTQKQVRELIEKYHCHLSGTVRFEETYRAGIFSENDIEWAEAFMRRFVCTLYKGENSVEKPAEISERSGQKAWFNRLTLRQFDHPTMWKDSEALSAAWGKLNLERVQKEGGASPRGLDVSALSWMMESFETPLRLNLFQRGERFVVVSDDAGASGEALEEGRRHGSFVASLMAESPVLQISGMNRGDDMNYPLDSVFETPIAIPGPDSGSLVLKTDHDEITLKSMDRPPWADGMGRDEDGFFVILPGDDFDRRVYWPEWSERVDHDNYGMRADLKINGVKQRFRWIRPGTFMMGSPEDEPERDDDERLHEVTLTNGFWMADTACVQELWEAAMGTNPSEFKGDKRPVEKVSWDDGMEFIGKINAMIPGLDLRLPTEAEWEYSCRAGSSTPFNFGDNITTDQANYDGKHPYHNGAKGQYRKKTVDTKFFPCNDWGLYEMHGNVREWCSDYWNEAYPEGKVVDPMGPDNGGDRVVRGGGWNDFGRNVRSASRNGYVPGNRWHRNGFRLARGHKSQGV